MRRTLTSLVLGALVLPGAVAFGGPESIELPVDDPAPDASVQESPADSSPEVSAPAQAPEVITSVDGVWAWIERVESEVLTERARKAIEQHAAARFAEGHVDDELGIPQVPLDLYDDPVAVLKVDPLHLDTIDPSEFDIPVVVNPEVKRWMRYFLGSGRRHMLRYLGRASTFEPMMRAALREQGLPEDMVYLSMMESGFNARAYSRVGAAGLWQFMPATGRMYKLRVDWWVDDRRDPVKSTKAAVEHLGDLHKMHKGDWLLAWSSYNAGPGRVRGAIRKGGTKDFWKLARGRFLPSETANYAPKIMAAAILSKHPARYGFTDIKPEPVYDVQSIHVQGSVSVELLAECAGMTPERFKWYNTGLRRWATPAEGYVVNVPSSKAEAFTAALAKVPQSERVRFVHHTVRRGESVSGIASRYGVATQEIVRVNRLANANRIVVGMSLVVPRPAARRVVSEPAISEPRVVASTSQPSTSSSTESTSPTVESTSASSAPSAQLHTVVSGDALLRIARTYGVTVAQLRAWNSLSTDLIHPGQVLKLSGSGGSTAQRVVRYTVASGDTLLAIAARYGVSAKELQGWNGVKDPSDIKVGQVLEVRRPTWTEVEVKSGDNLIRIAARNSCSVGDLQRWNKLSGTIIYPGQKLRVRR